MPDVMKFVLETTVLIPSSEAARFHKMELSELAEEMDGGAFIGGTTTRFKGVVPPGDLEDELLLIGNDGGFFDES